MLTGDMSSLVQIRDFSELTHLLGVVTQVLTFCSVLMKKTGSGRHTAFDGREREVAERLLIQNAQGSLRESKNFKQWQKQLSIFKYEEGLLPYQGRIDNADTVPYSPIPTPR